MHHSLMGNLVTEEDGGKDPNLEIFGRQMLDLWESGGESGNGEWGCELRTGPGRRS
jgi:hypothetical protein